MRHTISEFAPPFKLFRPFSLRELSLQKLISYSNHFKGHYIFKPYKTQVNDPVQAMGQEPASHVTPVFVDRE